MPAKIDLMNKRFGYLVVVGDAPSTCERRVRVRCDCGSPEKVVGVSGLRRNVRSCGCKTADFKSAFFIKHGHAAGYRNSPEYTVWKSMKSRCESRNHKAYRNYGARGVRVCERWRESFENFLADVGPRPSMRHSLDRFPDGGGHYEPGNVRWATRAEQARNTSRNLHVTFNGETMCVTDWERRQGFRKNTIRMRLKLGWSVEDAITTPIGAIKRMQCRKAA